jgi:hypothetical protein
MLLITRIVVIPHAPARVELLLPADQRCAELRVNGESMADVRRVGNRLELPLGTLGLPHTVEIACRARVDPSRNHLIEQPVLHVDDMPVSAEMTLWSVDRSLASQSPAIDQATTMTADDLTALRLDRWISIVEAATPAAADRGRPEVIDWARSWSQRFARWQAAENVGVDRPASENPQSSLVPAEADMRLAEIRQRISAWQGLFATAGSTSHIARDETTTPPDEFKPALVSGGWAHVACFATSGPVESIRVNSIRESRFLAGRPGALIVLACFAAAVIWAAGQSPFLTRFKRNSRSATP